MNSYIEKVLSEIETKNCNEKEYIQAVEEVLSTIEPVINEHKEFENIALLERMTEPERLITFRVPYVNDEGNRTL